MAMTHEEICEQIRTTAEKFGEAYMEYCNACCTLRMMKDDIQEVRDELDEYRNSKLPEDVDDDIYEAVEEDFYDKEDLFKGRAHLSIDDAIDLCDDLSRDDD